MTILETIPIMEQAGKYMPMMGLSAFIAISCLLIAVLLFKEDYDMGGYIFIISTCIAMLVFIVGIILSITEPKIDTGRKQYIIRLNNDININEFYDKYKIIEHTKYTDVYTVEEIND